MLAMMVVKLNKKFINITLILLASAVGIFKLIIAWQYITDTQGVTLRVIVLQKATT